MTVRKVDLTACRASGNELMYNEGTVEVIRYQSQRKSRDQVVH